jgi:NAD(P)-dependent dehydrogenase (short-subunit alcohol dehydrogenase family)
MTPVREQTVKSKSEKAKPLLGKVAIITGASQGIGRSIALELASHGADVVITARNQGKLTEVAASIRQTGSRAEIVAGDLRKPDFAAAVVAAALKAFGNIDIVVNCAGATKRGNFLELSDEDWHDGFELKLFGAVRLCRAAWPHLARRKGSIVNIAGAGGRSADIVFAVGGSVNAAMGYFTKALAEQGLSDGVQVNCINPGIIRTERTNRRIVAICKEFGIEENAAAQRLKDEFKITHFGEPEDVAELVAYMVSPRGRLMHGSVVDLDAGMTKGL